MKAGKSLMGLVAAAVLVLGAASAWAEFGSIAQASLDREINSPAVSTTVPASEVWDRQNRAPGSIAQASLDREINSPAVSTTVEKSVVWDRENRVLGSIAQESLDREIASPSVPAVQDEMSGDRHVRSAR
ncbi:MAG: hypothetical protein HYY65_14340 [Candidatus Tectomicrobia bacterium]|uniref:Uncharacterized protein n=1 Tax=Tectimicrobiota bacterium TaxID=2528274 RepID=A0A932GSG3_UNCTE|nr:hypothetical protein [Candidatus Tectomicrobia bacterium]